MDMMLTPEQEAMLHGKRAAGDLTTLWEDVDGFPLIPFTFTDRECLFIWRVSFMFHPRSTQTDLIVAVITSEPPGTSPAFHVLILWLYLSMSTEWLTCSYHQ